MTQAIQSHRWLKFSTAILLLAAALRLLAPDVYIMWIDEMSIHNDAINMIESGNIPLTGNIATFKGLAYHSPLTTYMIALPYAVFPDPVVARWFVGWLGVITVALIMTTVRRYMTMRAAFAAGLLAAVLPNMVDWSRFVWNPNVGQPFLALWFYTALRGYYDGSRRMQAAHWVTLSVTVQAQSALFTLIPVSFGMLLLGILRNRPAFLRTISATAAGMLLAGVTLLPWLIGLSQVEPVAGTPGAVSELDEISVTVSLPQPDVLIPAFGRLMGSVDFPVSRLGWFESPVGIWDVPIFVAITWLTAAAAVIFLLVMLLYGLRRPLERMPYLFIGGMGFYPFALYIVGAEGQSLADFYFMAALFAAIIALGTGWATLVQRFPRIRPPMSAAFGGIVAVQAGLTVAYIIWLTLYGPAYPVGNLVTARSEAASWLSGGSNAMLLQQPELIATLPDDEKFKVFERLLLWDIMHTFYDVRITEAANSLTLNPSGMTIITLPDSTLLIDWFGAEGIADDRWRRLTVNPQELPVALPSTPSEFNGALNVRGVIVRPPREDNTRGIIIVWQPLIGPANATYQFSLRLRDSNGNTLHQADGPTLTPPLWNPQEIVLTRFDVPAIDAAEAQIVVYTLPDIQALSVVDETGQPVRQDVLIPLDNVPEPD